MIEVFLKKSVYVCRDICLMRLRKIKIFFRIILTSIVDVIFIDLNHINCYLNT